MTLENIVKSIHKVSCNLKNYNEAKQEINDGLSERVITSREAIILRGMLNLANDIAVNNRLK